MANHNPFNNESKKTNAAEEKINLTKVDPLHLDNIGIKQEIENILSSNKIGKGRVWLLSAILFLLGEKDNVNKIPTANVIPLNLYDFQPLNLMRKFLRWCVESNNLNSSSPITKLKQDFPNAHPITIIFMATREYKATLSISRGDIDGILDRLKMSITSLYVDSFKYTEKEANEFIKIKIMDAEALLQIQKIANEQKFESLPVLDTLLEFTPPVLQIHQKIDVPAPPSFSLANFGTLLTVHQNEPFTPNLSLLLSRGGSYFNLQNQLQQPPSMPQQPQQYPQLQALVSGEGNMVEAAKLDVKGQYDSAIKSDEEEPGAEAEEGQPNHRHGMHNH